MPLRNSQCKRGHVGCFCIRLFMLWTKFSKELKENVYLPYLCFLIKGLGGGASFYFW